MEENKPQAKYSVVVLKAPKPDELAQFLSTKLNRNYDELRKLVSMAPATVVGDMDPIWAEDLVQTIKSMGADAEKRIIPSSLPCSFHPPTPGKTLCTICSKIICPTCVKSAGGKPVCPDCTGESKKIKIGFPWARLFTFIAIIGAAAFGYYWFTKPRPQFAWDRPYKLAIVGFMAELPSDWRGFIEELKKDTGSSYIDMKNHTLPDMVGWFQREYERYGGSDAALEIQIFGPLDHIELPPEPPALDEKWIDKIFEYRKFKSWFRTFDSKHELDFKDFDGVLYVQFVEGDYPGFSENLVSRKDRLGFTRCYLSLDLAETDIMIVVHEFMHMLSAQDHYDADGSPMNPEGLLLPFQDPLYPQPYADIMAGKVPESDSYASSASGLRDIRIGPYTAHEIGWLDDEQFESMIQNQESISFE